MADYQGRPRLGDYHGEEGVPSLGTVVESLLARVHALETEVEQLRVRLSELEAAAMTQEEK